MRTFSKFLKFFNILILKKFPIYIGGDEAGGCEVVVADFKIKNILNPKRLRELSIFLIENIPNVFWWRWR